MFNIFSFICICLNSTLYSSSFFFAKLPDEAYAFFNPIVDVMPVIPVLYFSLSLCLASCFKFSIKMKSLFNS
uniref:Photosystem II protein K n=1 Tax=Hexalectris warnockii TaxID=646080 RepID=A0A5J6KCA5_9ASPA|nr:photosystem II protein K [Hexalectris warnockii]